MWDHFLDFDVFGLKSVRESGGGVGGKSGLGQGWAGVGWVFGYFVIFFSFLMFLAQNQ